MNKLTKKKCKPCEGGVPPLTKEQALKFLEDIPDWMMDDSGTTIVRTYVFNDFQDAIVFVNKAAKIAEEEGHHPDIFVHGYRNVTVSLTTHAISGLSENDCIVAAKIDALHA